MAAAITLAAAAISLGPISAAPAAAADGPLTESPPCGYFEVTDGMDNWLTYYQNCSSQGVLIRSYWYYGEHSIPVDTCVAPDHAEMVAYIADGWHSPEAIGTC